MFESQQPEILRLRPSQINCSKAGLHHSVVTYSVKLCYNQRKIALISAASRDEILEVQAMPEG